MMGTRWDLNKVLGSRSAVEFVNANFPDAIFQEVYGRTICFIPNHFKTVEQTPFFKVFRNLFHVELNQKIVELCPVRGDGDNPEQSARDILKQIFDFDLNKSANGESRLMRFSALEGMSARPHVGKKYRIFPRDAQGGGGKANTKVSLASTFNAAGIIGVQNYHRAVNANKAHHEFDFMLALKDDFFLVPADRAT